MANGGALRTLFQLGFQVSPIVLSGGIAPAVLGGLLPIVVLTEALDIAGGVLTGSGVPDSLDDFFAQYMPLPGATLVSNAVGQYPFANQRIAANAIIQQPLQISLRMICPVRQTGGYFTKLPILTALQTALQTHNNSGGLYHIATPSFIYTNCIMVGMTDVTGGETFQAQVEWQMDFQQPLVTPTQAQSVLGSLMSKVTNGLQIQGAPAWSGPATAVGSTAQGAGSLVPGTNNLAGAVEQFLPGTTSVT